MIYRLQFDVKKSGGEFLIDTATRSAPVFADEATHTLQIGLFENDAGQDLTGITEATLTIYYGAGETLLTTTVAAPLDAAVIRLSPWNAGLVANFSVSISRDEMDYGFPVGEAELRVYLVVSGEFPDDETRILGKGYATLRNNVFGGEGLPAGTGEDDDATYSAHSLLAADGGKVVAARAIAVNELVGRKASGGIGSVPHPTAGEYQAGASTEVKSWTPAEVKAAILYQLANATTLVLKSDYSTLFSLMAVQATTGVPGLVTLAANQLLGRLATGGIVGIDKMGESDVETPGSAIKAMSPADVFAMIERWALTVDLSPATLYGRQASGAAGEIPRISDGEITAGTSTALRGVAAADLKAAVIAHKNGEASFGPKYQYAWVGAAALTPSRTAPISFDTDAADMDYASFSGSNNASLLFGLPSDWDGGPFAIRIYWLLPGTGAPPPPSPETVTWIVNAAVWEIDAELPDLGDDIEITTEINPAVAATLAASAFAEIDVTGEPGSLIRMRISGAEGDGGLVYGVEIRYVVDEADYLAGATGGPTVWFLSSGSNFLRRAAEATSVTKAAVTLFDWADPETGAFEGEILKNGVGTGVTLALDPPDLWAAVDITTISLEPGDVLAFNATTNTDTNTPQLHLWTT